MMICKMNTTKWCPFGDSTGSNDAYELYQMRFGATKNARYAPSSPSFARTVAATSTFLVIFASFLVFGSPCVCAASPQVHNEKPCTFQESPYRARFTRGAEFQHRVRSLPALPRDEEAKHPNSQGRQLEEPESGELSRPATDKPIHRPVILGARREDGNSECNAKSLENFDFQVPVFTDAHANGTDIIAPRTFMIDGGREEMQRINVSIRCEFRDTNVDQEGKRKCASLFDTHVETELSTDWILPPTVLSNLYSEFEDKIREANTTIGVVRVIRNQEIVEEFMKNSTFDIVVQVKGSSIQGDSPDSILTDEGTEPSVSCFRIDAILNPENGEGTLIPPRAIFHSAPVISPELDDDERTLEMTFTTTKTVDSDDWTLQSNAMDAELTVHSVLKGSVAFTLTFPYRKLHDINKTETFELEIETDGSENLVVPFKLVFPAQSSMEVSPAEITTEVFPSGSVEEFFSMTTVDGEEGSQIRFYPVQWDFALALFEADLSDEDPLKENERIKNMTDDASLEEIFADWIFVSLPTDINETRYFLEESSITENNFEMVIQDFTGKTGNIQGALLMEVHHLHGGSSSLFVIPIEAEVTFMFICRSDPSTLTPSRIEESAFQLVNVSNFAFQCR